MRLRRDSFGRCQGGRSAGINKICRVSEIAFKFHTRWFDLRTLRDVENISCFRNLKGFSADLEQAPNVTKVSGAARAHANLKAATMAVLLNEAMLSASTLSFGFEPTFHCIVTYDVLG